MQAVVKKVVYSFRYRLGPGQVGREVFHIVLIVLLSFTHVSRRDEGDGKRSTSIYRYTRARAPTLSPPLSLSHRTLGRENNKNILYHARRTDLTVQDLRNELRRLSGVRLQKCDQKLLAKISLAEMTIFSVNCQSLKKHAQDLRGNVLKESDVLLLSETWLDNFQHVGIENFLCVAKFKRAGVRAGGVAVYKNINKLQHELTQHAEIYAVTSDFICTHPSKHVLLRRYNMKVTCNVTMLFL